ncbi:C3a anaphylatoxin chemotactic receptor-like [Cyprinodon tularosa]|uniref:C3a anaphylatoxin chemotactic receptor-like n=1 Tax=Cyprinodon tularosa TaxID=77115 RepID=UPI0018E25EF5|nr:C3a anaphylatoxin chemotactic receptor-like [Cyprinodon tularosa]
MESDNGNGTSVHSSGLNIVKHIKTFSLVIYCAIILVGTVGNGLVIYVTGYKMKKTVNSVWFFNLALADFLFTAFLIFTAVSLYQDHHWPFGNFMCKLNSFVSVVNMFASVFFLTVISLDRCLSIWVVVWAQNKRTIFKAQVMSAVIWLAAGICSAPSAFLRTVKEEGNNTYCIYNITDKQKTSLYTFRFSLGFLVPFVVILFSYVAIGIRARRLQRTSKRRSRRIIFAIIFAFFICWFPLHVLSFIELKRLDSLMRLVQIGGPLTVCLAFMNSCLNPILYVFMCDEFQKKLKQSIWLVLENALAEDHLSYVGSSRSLSSWIPRKSVSTTPTGEDDAKTSMTLMEKKRTHTRSSGSTEESASK